MFSIVVCSIDSTKLNAFKENVASSIGVPYEIIVIDNLVEQRSLCSAYNVGAEMAQYPYLCFAHEDIAFHSNGWGSTISEKLKEKSCGVVGFAGSTGKVRELTTWYFNMAYRRLNLLESAAGTTTHYRENPDGVDFSEVVTLDGLCLMVRRDVWQEVRFDDKRFTGFHLYDLDFATAVTVAGYRNYVAHCVLVEHFSRGSFGREWYRWSEVYQDKWYDQLPLYVETLEPKVMDYNEKLARRSMNYLYVRFKILPAKILWHKIMNSFRDFPFSYKPWVLLLLFVLNYRKFPNN